MYFKRIRASNFKSFKNLEISLDKFNAIIGPNASGKSNFLGIIRFFRDIFLFNLENALSLQGSINSLKNIALNQKEIEMEITLGVDEPIQSNMYEKNDQYYGIMIKDSSYTLKIEAGKNHRDFNISYEKWRLKVIIYHLKEDEGEEDKLVEIEESAEGGFITLIKKGKIISLEKEPENLPIEIEDIFSYKKEYRKVEDFFMDKILIYNPILFSSYSMEIYKFFNTISLYDIDSKLPKKAIPFTGKKDLEENGNNIAIVLDTIFQKKKEKEKFNKILNDLLPFADDLTVDQLRDKSFITCLKECYCNHYFPAYLLSDGTINIVAMILILFFEKKSVIVLEEPDRNIHPQLLSRIIYMMEDVAKRLDKQIFITTHNPEIIRYIDYKKLITIKRDEDGFSQISKPSKNEEIKNFLKEMGVADLFIEGIL